jgi:hypothetical protein
MSIFTILFVILLIGWILGFGVFHVTGGLDSHSAGNGPNFSGPALYSQSQGGLSVRVTSKHWC